MIFKIQYSKNSIFVSIIENYLHYLYVRWCFDISIEINQQWNVLFETKMIAKKCTLHHLVFWISSFHIYEVNHLQNVVSSFVYVYVRECESMSISFGINPAKYLFFITLNRYSIIVQIITKFNWILIISIMMLMWWRRYYLLYWLHLQSWFILKMISIEYTKWLDHKSWSI